MAASLFLIVGLGNPGSKYDDTRHNIGFMLLDNLAEQEDCSINKSKMQGLYCRHRLDGHQVLFLKPQTYMNKSGECVRRFIDYFNVSLGNVLVIHDDIDLTFGRVKAVAKGGAGGHNGIRSIANHLHSTSFSRLKIGVGRPGIHDGGVGQPVDKYVLANFSRQEMTVISEITDLVNDAVCYFIKQDINACMNAINGRTSGE